MNLILKLCEYLMLYNIFNLIRIMGKLFFGSEGITPSNFDGKLNMKDCFRVNMEEWVTTLSKPLPFFSRNAVEKINKLCPDIFRLQYQLPASHPI